MDKIVTTIKDIDPSNWVVYALYFLVVLIIILVVYTLFTFIEEEQKKKKNLEFDLEQASIALDGLDNNTPISVPEEYEALEEENAIISYDELVEKTVSIPTILETRVKEEEEYEKNVPISIDEVKRNMDLKEVTSYTYNDKVIDEKEYLKELKRFRARLK